MHFPKRSAALIVVSAIVAGMIWLHLTDYRPLIRAIVSSTVADFEYQLQADDDDFKLLFCGTGSPNRTPDRASPCLALVANGKLFLFDAGEGAIAKLHEYKAPVLKLHSIFLTHLHSDHMSGVPEVLHNTWLFGRTTPVTTIGPPGTTKYLDAIRLAYADDVAERMHVLGHDGVDPNMAFGRLAEVVVEDGEVQTVYQDADLVIEAFRADHPDWTFAYGYRIRHEDKTIVISGDTKISEGIRNHARDADLLIHEAMNESLMSLIIEVLAGTDSPVPAARLQRIADVHSLTLPLADLAEEAGVKTLVLTHLIPPVPNYFFARKAFASGMSSRYGGQIIVAYDGLWMDLTSI